MDLGLRSYVLNNFNDLSLRNDSGELFENFCLLMCWHVIDSTLTAFFDCCGMWHSRMNAPIDSCELFHCISDVFWDKPIFQHVCCTHGGVLVHHHELHTEHHVQKWEIWFFIPNTIFWLNGMDWVHWTIVINFFMFAGHLLSSCVGFFVQHF